MAGLWRDKFNTYYLDTGDGVLTTREHELVHGVPVMVNPQPLENLPDVPLYPVRLSDLVEGLTATK